MYYSQGSIGIFINFTSSEAFNVTYNSISAKYRIIDETKPIMTVAINNSRVLYLYQIASGAWSNISLPTIIVNPYITFSYTNLSFYVLNQTSVLRYAPFTNEVAESFSLSAMAEDSAFILSMYNGSNWLVYSPGGGSSTIYVYDLNGNLVDTESLSEGVEPYTCTATSPGGGGTYYGYIMIGGTGDMYKLMVFEDGSLHIYSFTPNPSSPTAYPVGLAYGNNYLWIIERNGGLHKINVDTGNVESITVQPPYYPYSEGDRLIYYNGYLYHVREDGSSEVWVISVS